MSAPRCWLIRHPRAQGAAGRCIGRTDLSVDPRKAKRVAHRVRALQRRESLPRVVWTSPLQRAAAVGRVLRDWGWQHRIDPRLSELDFGRWDGRCCRDIEPAEVDAWVADFADHAPGGGESLVALLARLRRFLDEHGHEPLLVVTHAGVMQAAAWLHEATLPAARAWPPPPRHGAVLQLSPTQATGGGKKPKGLPR